MEKGITQQQLIAELSRSPHAAAAGSTHQKTKGKRSVDKDAPPQKSREELMRERLKEYTTVCVPGVVAHPEFYSRLLSWNLAKGQVKDSRVAMPVLALGSMAIRNDKELFENALSHLAALDPRLFVRALEFAKDMRGLDRTVRRLVERYVRNREADRNIWDRTMLQHRNPMTRLYKRFRIAPGGVKRPTGLSYQAWAEMAPYEWKVLEGIYEDGSVFSAVKNLRNVPILIAATLIAKHKISPLIALPALGSKMKEPALILEVIKSMTPTELVTNMKLLEKLGARQVPMLRAALDEALEKLKTSKKATLKTTKAAESVSEADEVLGAKMREAQERQIDAVSTLEGDWVVLGDRSGSMEPAIELSRQTSAILARSAKKTVILVFFDNSPLMFDVTGKTFEEITEITKRINSGGMTSIGCALNTLLVKQIRVDGIVIISDGAENTAPRFVDVFKRYCEFVGKVPPVYFYRVKHQAAGLEIDSLSGDCQRAGIELTTHDLASSADYYSLPNMIQTMRVDHYSLIDEVMVTPLLKLDDVLTRTTGMGVISDARTTDAIAR